MKRIFKNKIIFSLLFTLVLLVGFYVFTPSFAFAQNQITSAELGLEQVSSTIGLPTTDIRLIVARIIRIALGLLGTVAVVLLIYAGFLWMTAGGNEERISTAKKIMINGVIGLMIILSAYAIVNFVINKLVEATTGQVTTSGPPGVPGPSYLDRTFYIKSLPAGGQTCVRNVHLSITFNKEVNIDTLTSSSVRVITTSTGPITEALGSWRWATAKIQGVTTTDKTTAEYLPEGSCGASGPPDDCLSPSTTYQLDFIDCSLIKSTASYGSLSVNSALGAGCGDVNFITGEGVDRQPPEIVSINIMASTTRPDPIKLMVGDELIADVRYRDDNGVQKINIGTGGNYNLDSVPIAGCQKSGTVRLRWGTTGWPSGTTTFDTIAYDWAMQSDATSTDKLLRPPHCFDGEQNHGETNIDCGGSCGACQGGNCTSHQDCSLGLVCQNGTCEEAMRVTYFDKQSGAVGNYVSISGYKFGTQAGKVYMKDNSGQWNVEAQLANCGPYSWTNNQIIIIVPPGTASSTPIKVETATTTVGSQQVKYVDTTDTSTPPTPNFPPILSNFQVTNEKAPGLCYVVPDSGIIGSNVLLVGKDFGPASGVNGKVVFGSTNAYVNNWTNVYISSTVPIALAQGYTVIKVVDNNLKESNGVRFLVTSGIDSSAPFIESVEPASGAKGEYIVITGKNFGNNVGKVNFRDSLNEALAQTIQGDFSFPAGCKIPWSDKQIVVKFPTDDRTDIPGVIGAKYYVQVKTADVVWKKSVLAADKSFTLQTGSPKPGICDISPFSSPIPLPSSTSMKITGEYFNSSSSVYFWQTAASSTSISGRLGVLPPLTVADVSGGKRIFLTSVPSSTKTGPVIVYDNQKLSNSASFTVLDCTKNNNTCTISNTHCCSSGNEKGICKPIGELCDGETVSTGYIWRFSTKGIPLVPHVLEKCDSETEAGEALPTPSPSVLWDQAGVPATQQVHRNVCRTATVVVEFSQKNINPIDISNSANADLTISKCGSSSAAGRLECDNPQQIEFKDNTQKITPQVSSYSASVSTSYIQLMSKAGKWEDNTWYRVVLKDTISAGTSATGTAYLAKDRSCDVSGSAYCFMFRTDSDDCRLRAVIVVPYKYWTNVLTGLLQKPIPDLTYHALGLSEQRCVIMDVSGFKTSWASASTTYAKIPNNKKNTVTSTASSEANTVGILTRDAVNIIAALSTTTKTVKGFSPLTIDLSDPQIVDYWPNCLEACPNAEVGVKFSVTMSNVNLNNGESVKMYKCVDENCFQTGSSNEQKIQAVLKQNNSNDTEIAINRLELIGGVYKLVGLEPNVMYKVIVSASSSNVYDIRKLWSRANSVVLSSKSKPYNKEFSWRFRTKNADCEIDKVVVNPDNYIATYINDKTLFDADVYSKPDSCSSGGQRLNPWKLNWQWKSSDIEIATTTAVVTYGMDKYCTTRCIKKGSDIPYGLGYAYPVCGNSQTEAGEDCDPPTSSSTKRCGLDCLYMGNLNVTTTISTTTGYCGNGIIEPDYSEECDTNDNNTKVGCSVNCLHTGSSESTAASNVTASICGNGMIGSGEDCDIGITATTTDPKSAYGCSAQCLHTGTKLASNWCLINKPNFGGFDKNDFSKVCKNSLSQCGDGVFSEDEDMGCDENIAGKIEKASWCNNLCLKTTENPADLGAISECVANQEGCDSNGQHLGSSLFYKDISFCGDGEPETGEDDFCETGNLTFVHETTNPWALAEGVGKSINVIGNPPAQIADIIATARVTTLPKLVDGNGQFIIPCGYKEDSECLLSTSVVEYGVAKNSCCYPRPRLISVYPSSPTNTCPNTVLEAEFDKVIDQTSLADNLLIARGFTSVSASNCTSTDDVTKLIKVTYGGGNNIPWYKQLWLKIANFFQKFFGNKVMAAFNTPDFANIDQWCAGDDVGTGLVHEITSTTSKISVSLSKPLATTTHYAIILKEGVKDKLGVSIGNDVQNKTAKGTPNWNWQFKTADKICEVDSVGINPSQVYLSKYGATSTLEAIAYTGKDKSQQKIQSIPSYYSWEYIWAPMTNSYVTLTNTTSTYNLITAQNRNGEIDVYVSANITDNKYTNKFGIVATGKSHVVVYLCENPWPPKDLYLKTGGQTTGPFIIFPYEDKLNNNDNYDAASGTFDNKPLPESPLGGYFNFSAYYCADSGSTGTHDDLPYLKSAVQVSGSLVSVSTSLKRFLFANNKNNDVIGIQIFSNPKHLAVDKWFQTEKGFVGAMNKTKVDGYEAVTDGNNIYVDVLNYATSTGASGGSLYTNVYLFSINSDAQSETKKVFDEMMKNIKFNINLTNYGYCGSAMDKPGATTTCKDDFDCGAGEICSAQTDKLKRNYQRLKDLQVIELALGGKTATSGFPALKEGTYLKGQTISTWNSWSTLGSAVNYSLPSDPINELGKAGTCKDKPEILCFSDAICQALGSTTSTCAFHDSTSGWSVEDRRFSFACNTSSLAYRYIISTSTGYVVRARFENPFGNGLVSDISNWSTLVDDFIDANTSSKRFKVSESSGVCLQTEEVSTLVSGYCGDGQINKDKGEECEMPSVKYDKSGCNASGGKMIVYTCNNKCGWDQKKQSCVVKENCGNSTVDPGEDCDEGNKNQTYNVFCTNKCKVPLKSAVTWPYCGDGHTNSKYEVCDYSLNKFSLYQASSTNKLFSCNYDCQSYGPYCGDGMVQNDSVDKTNIGASEECEGSMQKSCTTTINTIEVVGIQACVTSTCKYSSVCTTTASMAVATSTKCGNDKVESGEKCDVVNSLGVAQNGVVCTPTYGKSCSYCRSDCKEWVDVQPTEYCGDGIMQGNEVCDADPTSSTIIYVATSNASTTETTVSSTHNGYRVLACEKEKTTLFVQRKGSKSCDSCKQIKDECVSCGLMEDDGKVAASISGEVINVLMPTSTNPLMVESLKAGTIHIFLGNNFNKPLAGFSHPMSSNPLPIAKFTLSIFSSILNMSTGEKTILKPIVPSSKIAYFNSNGICSYGDEPKYKIEFNAGGGLRDFPILSPEATQNSPWQYDMMLSPFILKSVNEQKNHIRVVVKWTGDADFYGGFKVDKYTYVGPTLIDYKFASTTTYESLSFKPTIGRYYYNNTASTNKVANIWYHGFGETKIGGTQVESFTADIGQIPLENQNYSFYVRLNETDKTKGIEGVKNSANLQVEVYLPDDYTGYEGYRLFDKPDLVYSLTSATPSNNKGAKYWQVFNLKTGSDPTISSIVKKNTIITNVSDFQY